MSRRVSAERAHLCDLPRGLAQAPVRRAERRHQAALSWRWAKRHGLGSLRMAGRSPWEPVQERDLPSKSKVTD